VPANQQRKTSRRFLFPLSPFLGPTPAYTKRIHKNSPRRARAVKHFLEAILFSVSAVCKATAGGSIHFIESRRRLQRAVRDALAVRPLSQAHAHALVARGQTATVRWRHRVCRVPIHRAAPQPFHRAIEKTLLLQTPSAEDDLEDCKRPMPSRAGSHQACRTGQAHSVEHPTEIHGLQR